MWWKEKPSFPEEQEAGSRFGFCYFYPLHPKQDMSEMCVRSGKLQGESRELMFSPPFPCSSCIPSAKLPNPTFLHLCFPALPEAAGAGVWILCFVVQAQGTLCINLGNSLRMVTGNLLIAMETWALL